MSELIKNIVENIKDNEKAQIKLTTVDNKQINLSCTFKIAESPRFFLVFESNTILHDLDLGKKQPVTVSYKKSSITFSTNVLSIIEDHTLELKANETLDPVSLREYFRVDMSTPIEAAYETRKKSDTSKDWSILGKTQDLSASGVLALFPKEPLNNHQIYLNIQIPDTEHIVRAIGHVIHKRKLRGKRWQVAFHFDVLSDKHKDYVIQCCLREQRKQLRERIIMGY